MKTKTEHTLHVIKERIDASQRMRSIFYEITLIGVIILAKIVPNRSPWWSNIEPHIMLGAQPQRNDGTRLDKLGVAAVLTLQEPYELETRLFIKPVNAQQWKNLGIERLILDTSDLDPLSDEIMEAGYQFMKQAVDNGQKVYVHCKAGEGRSATMVAVYLTLSGNYNSIEDALIFLKYRRPQVNPNKEQIEAAVKFVMNYVQRT